MSRFEVAKKRLSSPSIKLDKLHKDYPKSAATRSCSNGKVTPPNEDPETQGHDLRDSDTFGKIVSTFSEVQKRCKLFRSKCHKRIVYGSMSWMTLKYHGTKYRSKSILRWRTKKKFLFRLALFSRSTFIDTWYNMKKNTSFDNELNVLATWKACMFWWQKKLYRSFQTTFLQQESLYYDNWVMDGPLSPKLMSFSLYPSTWW